MQQSNSTNCTCMCNTVQLTSYVGAHNAVTSKGMDAHLGCTCLAYSLEYLSTAAHASYVLAYSCNGLATSTSSIHASQVSADNSTAGTYNNPTRCVNRLPVMASAVQYHCTTCQYQHCDPNLAMMSCNKRSGKARIKMQLHIV